LLERRAHRSDHLAAVDPDPDPERDPVTFEELVVQSVQPGEHLEGGLERSRRVILPNHGDPEHGHDGVADELLHGAAPGGDGCGHRGEVGVEEGAKALRV